MSLISRFEGYARQISSPKRRKGSMRVIRRFKWRYTAEFDGLALGLD